MPDHVHLLVRASSTASPAKIAKQVKGVSTALLNDIREAYSEPFDWQDGYGCFSISRPHVAGTVMYVKDQKQHHNDNRIWPEWEETNEPG